ncbi:hypothetical protein B7463_g8364, partial [Scytalidium lignicola]
METSNLIQPPRLSTNDPPQHILNDIELNYIKSSPVSWSSLPRKSELAILFLCRFVDFLHVASLQPYLFYQLKSFDPSLSDSALSSQVGILQGSFTGAQVMTAMLWGRVADSSVGGRKLVLLIGLGGTAISCLGYGFATSFSQAVFWRVYSGAINGMVGIIRTMIGELITEKKYQSRAFLILPMSFNVAGILGPVMGGLLADPTNTLPGLFGNGAIFNSHLMQSYPYALPNIINTVFLMTAFFTVFFGLQETLKERQGEFDLGLYLAKKISAFISCSKSKKYSPLNPENASDIRTVSEETFKIKPTFQYSNNKLPFRRIWIPNVVFTLATITLFEFQLGAFTNLWSLFLSTPRPSPSDLTSHPTSLPFVFIGGLGMPASTVGFATSILGLLGMTLQFSLYPHINSRLGTLRSLQYFLTLFPLAYFLAPYLAVLSSTTISPAASAGIFIWIGITLVLFLQVTARTFTLPATIILLNNCSPHPSVLGTVHGVGQSISAASRTIGPLVSSWLYGTGLEIGVIGLAWWGTALVAVGITPATSKPLNAEYSGNTTFTPGQLLTTALVATQPSVSSYQVLNGTFTLLMMDPDGSYNGSATKVLHWLQTDLTVSDIPLNQTFPLENSQNISALAPYYPPSPPLENPPHPHHYTLLLFSQPNGTPLKISSDLNTTLTYRVGFNLTSFVQNTRVGQLVTATFFDLVNTTSTTTNSSTTTSSSPPTSTPNSAITLGSSSAWFLLSSLFFGFILS